METFVQIGAGNIGRSFIGQLFARAGFEVIFVDVAAEIIEALNTKRRYRIEIKDRVPQTIWIENVRGIYAQDVASVARALADCRCCGTAVGPKALPAIYPLLAAGLKLRYTEGKPPLDIIICENLREAAAHMRQGLAQHLPPDFPLEEMAGLVETSIGKMVPIMSAEERARDPLLVYAEAYNTLICDARGFKNPIPNVPGLEPKENMKAYVDRKLFIHNFGHALCAYLGYLYEPAMQTTWQAVEDPVVGPAVRAGMWEAAQALIKEYPDEFNEHNLGAHIEDLLMRFANKALGDTLHRVGRDIQRKLAREDRVIGPLLLELQHGLTPRLTPLCAAAALHFRAPDEQGQLYPPDQQLFAELLPKGLDWILENICGLNPAQPLDAQAIKLIKAAAEKIRQAGDNRKSLLEGFLQAKQAGE